MDIISELAAILARENYTFAQLATHLDMSEEQLSEELSHKSLPLRKLELISKALRVPLYSFFRPDHPEVAAYEKPFYVNKLWTGDDAGKTVAQLRSEISLLKQIIHQKEEQLKKQGA